MRVHSKHLDRLISHLERIGERKKDVLWIGKEMIWKNFGENNPNKLCDILIVYYGGMGVPVELKKSINEKSRAKEQILSGKRFLELIQDIEVPYGKMVIYGGKEKYKVFTYDFKSGIWI